MKSSSTLGFAIWIALLILALGLAPAKGAGLPDLAAAAQVQLG